jgi:serine protease Do
MVCTCTSSSASLFAALIRWVLVTALLSFMASAQSDPLSAISDALEKVVAKVEPAVVEVDAIGMPVEDDEYGDDASRSDHPKTEHSIGSGVILDPMGYIVTSAHVVSGASSLTVTLEKSALQRPGTAEVSFTTIPAHFIGEFRDADLAVIKVDAAGLPSLPLNLRDDLKQGQLVVALGSPQGFRNSVSMGVVSSVGRQVTPDGHVLYVQTDAAINPGNSGGALVDIKGNLVGINAYFVTQGGGSEGLGFAIPARLVEFVYQTIRKTRSVPWGSTGLRVQGITPTLAAGLHLPRDSGVVVSDVLPRTPAEVKGVKARDLIVRVDGKPLDNLPQYYEAMYHKASGDKIVLTVLRESHLIDLEVPVVAGPPESDSSGAAPSPTINLVAKLGIFCSELGARRRVELAHLRSRTGVLVEAKAAGSDLQADLIGGDVIRSVNLTSISSVAELQSLLDRVKPGTPIVLQVERKSQFLYLPVDTD